MYREEFKTLCRSVYPCCLFEDCDTRCSIYGPTWLSTIMTTYLDKNGEVVKLTNDYPKGSYKVKITEKNVIRQVKWHVENYDMYLLMEKTYSSST